MPKRTADAVRVTTPKKPEPGVVLWCQHADCGVGIDMAAFIDAGSNLVVPPSQCPKCLRETTWHTLHPWKVTKQDVKLFMKPRGIDPET